MDGRTARDSMVEMTEIVLPEDSNSRGTIFGGRVLALVDKCAAVAALRHARSEVTTVSFDSVEFRHTVRVGNILLLHGRLNAAFGSSMEIEVEVMAEEPATGARTLTTRALVTMVALGGDGRPTKVPPLLAQDEEDRRRAHEAGARRARRLAERP
ncbi:MAG TPA: acyl-CoA thioesterase [Candidatus Polarisedimenticolaceae bacterium]|nr:acyl-CoA thioesterase [Candidatus Polarisedimenticolaceae bacterium]